MIGFLTVQSNIKNFGVIIGATGFLGSRLAFEYAAAGIDLVLAARNPQKLEKLKLEIGAMSKVTLIDVVVDLEEKNFIEKISKVVDSHTHKVRFVIIATGSQHPIGEVLSIDSLALSRSFQVNLIAPILISQYFASKFIKNGSGSLLLLSGGGGTSPRSNFSAYATAKTGLIRFVETFSQELQLTNVQINCISPGIMPSKMMEEIVGLGSAAGEVELLKAIDALQDREYRLYGVLKLCKFLTSNASKGITGKLISAEWDNWEKWPLHIDKLQNSDLYTLRRITGRDRGEMWGDLP